MACLVCSIYLKTVQEMNVDSSTVYNTIEHFQKMDSIPSQIIFTNV